MNDIDLAGIRIARPVACFFRRNWRRSSSRFTYATLCTSAALALRGPASASGQTASAPSSAPQLETSLLQQGCERGNAVMCNDMGVSYLHGAGVAADVSLALRAFERSCRHGSADGCSNLGALYESGVGVTASFAQASRLYERACTMGCALGCSNLGALYARGLGATRDLEEARRLFTLACETGSAAGCSNLLQLPPPALEHLAAR